MLYFYLLSAGILVSAVHVYVVWQNRANPRYSVSENAITNKKRQLLYFVTHVITEVLFLLYAYQFFIVKQIFILPFVLIVVFAVLDFIQAVLPSRSKTEGIHIITAYISWICYLSAGFIALIGLQIREPYRAIAAILLIPILGMFVYMHINRSKLYPYQLMVVPLYVIYMLMISFGAA